MKNPLFPLILSFLLLIYCNPKITSTLVNQRPPLAYDAKVYVVSVSESLPKGVKAVGKMAIKDTGFTTKCTYDMVLEQAKLKARESGANVVKIIEHKTPTALGSSCHRLKVVLYHLADVSALQNKIEEPVPVIRDADYALLHVYRYPGPGAIVGYNLQLGDTTICRVKNNYKEVIKIRKEDLNILWAKTESKAEVPIDIVFGKSYFLRCSMKMGVAVGRPSLTLVDYTTGKQEFEAFEARNNITDQE